MRLSVVIPARNERYLSATVADLLNHAVGDLEIIPVLDGEVQDPSFVPLPTDPRVRPIYHQLSEGMRPSINEAIVHAQGDYILKCDAHCRFAPGFDAVLLGEIDHDWVVVPRRYSLEPKTWSLIEKDGARDAHYLCFPFRDPAKEPVLRGLVWRERGPARAHILLDDEMSSQGSCWVMSRQHWDRIGPLDTEHYGPFIQEFQEVGCKTWLSGGTVKINKRTWYAHWYKREGQGYALSRRQSRMGIMHSLRMWFHDQWQSPLKVRPFSWLVEHFWPVPCWPDNWKDWQEDQTEVGLWSLKENSQQL